LSLTSARRILQGSAPCRNTTRSSNCSAPFRTKTKGPLNRSC
jgi:hypothetical protein